MLLYHSVLPLELLRNKDNNQLGESIAVIWQGQKLKKEILIMIKLTLKIQLNTMLNTCIN